MSASAQKVGFSLAKERAFAYQVAVVLQDLRTKQRLTCSAVDRLAHSYSGATSRIENGFHEPSLTTLTSYAAVFGVTVSWIVREAEERLAERAEANLRRAS